LTAAFLSCSHELPTTTTSPTSKQDGALNWLQAQIVPNQIVPQPFFDRHGLIISYRIPKTDSHYPNLFARSWIYDDAIAVTAFTMVKDYASAKGILTALNAQIDSDGKLGFSYNTNDAWYHQYYRSGALAWLGYAICFYQQNTGDAEFKPMAESIASYLLSLQDTNAEGKSYGSVRGGPDVSWYSTEHNIGCYFFLRELSRIIGKALYTTTSNLIKASLLKNHWNASKGCFNQGIGDEANALDVASLGAMFLISIGEKEQAQQCLNFAEKAHFTHDSVDGYAPYEGKSLVWTEGTLQMAMAYRKLGNENRSQHLVNQIKMLQDAEGGIPYSTRTDLSIEFQTWPSVAGTAWLVMMLFYDNSFLGI